MGREQDARGSPMPRTDFRLSHTAHRQRSRKRPEQKSPELRPCARAEREAAALGAHYFLHSCTSCCLKYLRSSSSTSTKLRKYLTENLLLMFLNVGVRLSNLRACKRTQAWARGVALHAGAGRPPIAGWACRALTRQGRVGSGWTRPGRARLATVGGRRVECGSRELGGNAQRAACDREKAASAKQGWSACGRAERWHRP